MSNPRSKDHRKLKGSHCQKLYKKPSQSYSNMDFASSQNKKFNKRKPIGQPYMTQVAVKEKQDALREASKAKAEEAAAAKADKERYLNMYHCSS
jgi:hypothetical protein